MKKERTALVWVLVVFAGILIAMQLPESWPLPEPWGKNIQTLGLFAIIIGWIFGVSHYEDWLKTMRTVEMPAGQSEPTHIVTFSFEQHDKIFKEAALRDLDCNLSEEITRAVKNREQEQKKAPKEVKGK